MNAAWVRIMDAYSCAISQLSETYTYAPVSIAMEAEALMADLRAHADEIHARVMLNSSLVGNGAANQEAAE